MFHFPRFIIFPVLGSVKAMGRFVRTACPPVRLRVLLMAPLVLWLAGCAGPGRYPNVTHFSTVVVDPGHGGHDSGAISRNRWVVTSTKTVRGRRGKRRRVTVSHIASNGGPRVVEKEVALDVAIRVQRKLRAAGLRVVMTRRDDTFVPLDERANIYNRQRDAIFVAIHFNDACRRSAHGMETYHNGKGTLELAGRIERAISACPGGENRGVHRANFRVLRNARGPAVLVECGYLSNPEESVQCANPAFREQIASAIVRAILEQRR